MNIFFFSVTLSIMWTISKHKTQMPALICVGCSFMITINPGSLPCGPDIPLTLSSIALKNISFFTFS